ncbi:Glyoxalase/Bleomycin resistance protein/Dihydroxybiphenyl dioxygenase [Aspergillus pseudoustus]|uniref:Glyoxalase/Bleomycin resistance protein/Dihydroxybiphenyl dioxygenase n=1 Tax=Aspergillus pseudoustus TaxID=1810923 RepID=A0ABR4JPT1_9EURO
MSQRNPDNRIRLLATAFVVYYHADLAKARQFYLDFGLAIAEEREGEIYFRGYGTEPFIYRAVQAETGSRRFGGAAYSVESRADLEKAAALAQASPISSLDAPGGGEIVTLTDPVGHQVHLIYGQEQRPAEDLKIEKLTVNYEDDKPRKGRFQRFNPGPAPVHRWGHYGVTYPAGKYQEMYDWYTNTLALAPSDIVYRDGQPITCFFHIDRGLEFTDHHAFFFKPAKPGVELNVAHAAFEVHDFDIQQLGHQHLRDKGYKLCWGVGRHVLGSQVFDYWFDSSGFVVEHYADGDLVNSETPVAKVQAGPQALSVWGPPVPDVF